MKIDFTKYRLQHIPLLGLLVLLAGVLVADHTLADHLSSSFRFYLYGGGVLFALTVLAAKVNGFRFNWGDAACLLFVFYLLVQYWLKDSTATSKLLELVFLSVLYLAFRLFFSAQAWNLPVGNILLSLLGTVIAVWGLLQLYGYSLSQHSMFPLTGPFFNPGPFAGFLAVIFPLALYNAFQYYATIKEVDSWKSLQQLVGSAKGLHLVAFALSVLCCMCILLVLPAARSRAAWIAAGGGGLLIALVYHWSFLQQAVQAWSVRFRLIVGLVLFFLFVCGSIFLYGFKKDSADGRGLIWKVSTDMVRQYPLWGTGAGTFAGAYGQAQISYFTQGVATVQEQRVAGNPDYAFNEYIQLAVELGLVGLLLFLVVLLASIGQASVQWKENVGLLGCLLSFLLFAAFSYPFSVLPFGLVFTYLLAALNTRCPQAEQKPNASPVLVWSMKLIVVGTLLGLLPYQHKVFQAYETWKKCSFGTAMQRRACFKSIYPELKDQAKFLFEYGQTLSQQGQYVESNTVLQQGLLFSCDPMFHNVMGKNYQSLKDYAAAEAAFQNACHMVPERLYPYYLLARLYKESGRWNKALEMARHVVGKEPKVNSTAVREMKNEMKQLLKDHATF